MSQKGSKILSIKKIGQLAVSKNGAHGETKAREPTSFPGSLNFLSLSRSWGQKMRDPGNEVHTRARSQAKQAAVERSFKYNAL